LSWFRWCFIVDIYRRLAVGISQHGNLEDKLKTDQNKDGRINRKDMIKIIDAMLILANQDDRLRDKSSDKRADFVMQRLNKDRNGKTSMKTRKISYLEYQ
jgi:Ca2+-binding EF-hand superfamily protein